ncbi:MmcQ/YjbR family DNA-binding protein [Lysobacter fragariae]
MDTETLKVHCGSKPGAQAHLYAAPSNILVFAVEGRKFAYFKTSDPEKWRFSVRVTPDRFIELTDVPGIKPARYFARFHWVTIVDVRRVPEDYLRELVAWSYWKAMDALPKSRRLALTGVPDASVRNSGTRKSRARTT